MSVRIKHYDPTPGRTSAIGLEFIDGFATVEDGQLEPETIEALKTHGFEFSDAPADSKPAKAAGQSRGRGRKAPADADEPDTEAVPADEDETADDAAEEDVVADGEAADGDTVTEDEPLESESE